MTNYYSCRLSTKEILKANVGKYIDVDEPSKISVDINKEKGGDVIYITITQEQNSKRIMVKLEMPEIENYLVEKYFDKGIYIMKIDTGSLLDDIEFSVWCNKDLNSLKGGQHEQDLPVPN